MASGAFVAWIDASNDAPAYEYPEITGYALTYLGGLAALSEHEGAIGHHAADWLVDRVLAGSLAARDAWDNDAVYLFDLGMIATGLLTFGRRRGVERYVEAGASLVRFLGDEISSSGEIVPVARRGPGTRRRNWSTLGVAHLGKLVQSFLLADTTGEYAAHVVSSKLVDAVRSLQRPDGAIVTEGGGAAIMLHPHLYAAEGLWIWGSAVDDVEAIDAARAAVAWTWTHQLPDGGLPRSGTGDDRCEQSDVTAQAVRLTLALEMQTSSTDRAVSRLVQVARRHRGALAIPYQPRSQHAHLNTWATLFAAQAITMAVPGTPALSWQALV